MSKYKATSLAVNKKSKVKFFNHETLRRVVLLWCQQKKDHHHKQEINQEWCQREKKTFLKCLFDKWMIVRSSNWKSTLISIQIELDIKSKNYNIKSQFSKTF